MGCTHRPPGPAPKPARPQASGARQPATRSRLPDRPWPPSPGGHFFAFTRSPRRILWTAALCPRDGAGLARQTPVRDKATMAKLYFSYSTMNAGKSTLLLQAAYNYRERGMRALLFTSSLYAEGGAGLVVSRIGISAPAELYGDSDDLFDRIHGAMDESKVDCVLVDESQFLTRDQVWQLARVADRLGIPVMCYGLRTDFLGRLFPGSAELLAVADVLREIRTICYCGAKATMVVRKGADGRVLTEGSQVSIEKSVYVSLCRRHWEEETGR